MKVGVKTEKLNHSAQTIMSFKEAPIYSSDYEVEEIMRESKMLLKRKTRLIQTAHERKLENFGKGTVP